MNDLIERVEVFTQSVDNKYYQILFAVLTTVIIFGFIKIIIHRFTKSYKHHTSNSTSLNYELVLGILSKTKDLYLLLLGGYVGIQWFELRPKIEHFADKLIIVATLFQVAVWGTKAINIWVEKSLSKRAQKNASLATTIGLINIVTKTVLYTTITLITLSNLGVNVSALIAGLGVGGIAVALASQSILADLFASLSIILDRPFLVGDAITVGPTSGTVEHIGLKTTRLRSATGEQIIISNGDLLKSTIKNHRRMIERRVSFQLHFPLTTQEDILKKINPIIEQAITSTLNVRFERSHFKAIGPQSFTFETAYWVTSSDYNQHMDSQQEIYFKLVSKFTAEQVQLDKCLFSPNI